ncbi:hypothetical protein [Crocinitomix algicola]|uniref:hypothetical protein n=1 Tax=Crocinitomix algicola TaxID=1740263 RepID=UPI000871E8D4|nr:hypothetical protein [Crocinitomix algicola]
MRLDINDLENRFKEKYEVFIDEKIKALPTIRKYVEISQITSSLHNKQLEVCEEIAEDIGADINSMYTTSFLGGFQASGLSLIHIMTVNAAKELDKKLFDAIDELK